MSQKITDEQLEIIIHSLGLDYPDMSKKGPFRNLYCARADDPALAQMVADGLMRPGYTINLGRDRYYHVTHAGAEAVGLELPKE